MKGSLDLHLSILQETCSSQRERIRILECQLAAANEKLKVMSKYCGVLVKREYVLQQKWDMHIQAYNTYCLLS